MRLSFGRNFQVFGLLCLLGNSNLTCKGNTVLVGIIEGNIILIIIIVLQLNGNCTLKSGVDGQS